MAQIIGRLTKDAVSKTTESGKQLVEFSLVEVYSYKNKDGERVELKTFFNCVIWNNEKIAPYLTKGKPMMLWGVVEANAYESNEGKPKANLRMTVKDYEFLPSTSNKKNQQAAEKVETVTEEAAEDLPF